jgi:TRAP-type uncharacterized transport system fused permease subunit
MGVMADRAMKFVIAASIALVLMSLQGWWTSDVYGTIHGLHADGLTSIGDGLLVLPGAAAACVLALVGLVHPASRRASGIAIGLLGTAMLAVTVYDILYLPTVPDVLVPFRLGNGDGSYYATPELYFAAATCFLIGLAGLTMALAPRDGTGNEHEQQETPAWA